MTGEEMVAAILAGIAEDEGLARLATEGPWLAEGPMAATVDNPVTANVVSSNRWGSPVAVSLGDRRVGACLATDAPHIARHDPARVLRECAAKREIVEEHQPRGVQGGPPYRWTCATCDSSPVRWDATVEWPCATIRALASVYTPDGGVT